MLYLRPERGWRHEGGRAQKKGSPRQNNQTATEADPGEEEKHRETKKNKTVREVRERKRRVLVQDEHGRSEREKSFL